MINPNTVARVYTELEREGVINTRPGLGVFVAHPKAELTRKVRKERLDELLDHFLTEAVHLRFTADEIISLVTQRVKGVSMDRHDRDAPPDEVLRPPQSG